MAAGGDRAALAAARSAGLHYTDQDEPGILRTRRGKGFSYRGPSGDAITDPVERDRIAALADIVPPTYRKKLSSAANTTYDWTASSLSFSGKALRVISTSALLLGIPWALAFSEEQQMQEMEREMRMQQGASEVLTGGAQTAKPAL